MSFPTVMGDGVEGQLMREPQVCLGPAFANAQYNFFVSGSAFATPANVYQDAGLTTPFPNQGIVNADSFGRFPPIYLDGSIIYGVQCFDGGNNLVWQADPYTPPLSTRGLSTNVAFGPQFAVTGEVTLPAPAAGGSQITLKLAAAVAGQSCLQVSSTLAGQPTIIINNSVTTGAQTATFTATNKPGTATSSPAGWLPLLCDGVIYYTPIWHGNNFTPYTPNPAANGETINATSVTFNGNGSTTANNGTANPGSWFTPNAANVGSGYFVQFSETAGLSGLFITIPAVATVAPSGGAYTGGNLTANFAGTTASNYVIQLTTGQRITGCTFTNGAAAFTTPATSIVGTPTTALLIGPASTSWINISNSGQTFGENAAAQLNGNYQLSTSITGSPVVASGTMQFQGGNGAQQPTYNGAASLVLNGDGSATLNGVAASNWFSPAAAHAGDVFWINITRSGGTTGVNFSAAQGAFTNITNAGLTINLTGTGARNATGTYQISANSGGTLIVAQGSITLTAAGVLNTNWSGTAPLKLNGNGTATLNGVSTTSWYSPTTSNVGSGYWIDITRTSGTSGVNFSAAQGSWTNITNSGLSITLSGTSGNVGTVTANGTYQISSSGSGTPVLGSGTISLSVSGLTVIHVYTSGSNATETILAGTTTVKMEIWGSGGGGTDGSGSGCGAHSGTAGGCGGYARSQYTAAALGGVGKTFKYTIGAVGVHGGTGTTTNGSAGTIVNGTVGGFTNMTGNGGGRATGLDGSGPGAGGTASGGNQANTTGASGSTVGVSGNISGDGSPYGGGGSPGGFGAGNPGGNGQNGAAVFLYS